MRKNDRQCKKAEKAEKAENNSRGVFGDLSNPPSWS
jgi:2-hydroxychromene-2-carboxylate isomerase